MIQEMSMYISICRCLFVRPITRNIIYPQQSAVSDSPLRLESPRYPGRHRRLKPILTEPDGSKVQTVPLLGSRR